MYINGYSSSAEVISNNNLNCEHTYLQHPIYCPKCGKSVGLNQEDIMFLVITHNWNCPYCGTIIILATGGVTW